MKIGLSQTEDMLAARSQQTEKIANNYSGSNSLFNLKCVKETKEDGMKAREKKGSVCLLVVICLGCNYPP